MPFAFFLPPLPISPSPPSCSALSPTAHDPACLFLSLCAPSPPFLGEFIRLPCTCWGIGTDKAGGACGRVMGAGIMLTPQHPTRIENASVSLSPWETGTAEIPSDNAAPV